MTKKKSKRKCQLAKSYRAEMERIFKRFERIDKILLFGSRAMGTAKRYSDIDLAVIGRCGLKGLAQLKDALEDETGIPFFFDVVAYNQKMHVGLKKHIDTYGVEVFKKQP